MKYLPLLEPVTLVVLAAAALGIWIYCRFFRPAVVRTPQQIADAMTAAAEKATRRMEDLPRDQLALVLTENYRRVAEMWEAESRESPTGSERQAAASSLAIHARLVYQQSLAFYARFELKP